MTEGQRFGTPPDLQEGLRGSDTKKTEKLPKLADEYGEKADSEGYVRLGDVDRTVFDGRQAKNIAALLDGTEGVNLGADLRFKGNSGNYTDMRIHIDSLDELVERMREYYGK